MANEGSGCGYQRGGVAKLKSKRMETYWEVQRVSGDHNC